MENGLTTKICPRGSMPFSLLPTTLINDSAQSRYGEVQLTMGTQEQNGIVPSTFN